MDGEFPPQQDVSSQTADDQNGQSPRRPYEKPRLDPHDFSNAILGNATPNFADGSSGAYRP